MAEYVIDLSKSYDYILHIKTIPIKIFDWFVLKLQGNETETLKPHYIHVYKVFG